MPLLTDGRATGRGAGEEEEVSRRFRVTASDVEGLFSENDSRPLAIS
jgi:hypothetical protein